MMANSQSQCQECGCKCSKCIASDHYIHLHVEIETLKQKLIERDDHIATMETNFLNDTYNIPNEELNSLKEDLAVWQDKYKRLYEAHRRVQRVNQGLEDKLLKLVDVCETEKNTLTKDVATLSQKLAEANYANKKLMEDNERYKSDVALAIQFLQCNQSYFVPHKIDSLPNEVQAKVTSYVASKRKPEEKKTAPEVKNIKVPIPTFPPTAMVYSVPKSVNSEKEPGELENQPVDVVSAAIMAKILEERERERSLTKHCDTCTCAKNLKIIYDVSHHSVGVQTNDSKTSLCLRCNAKIEGFQTFKLVQRTDDPKADAICPCDPDKIVVQNDCDNKNSDDLSVRAKVESKESLCVSTVNSTGSVEGQRDERTEIPDTSADHHHLCDKFHSNNGNSAKGLKSGSGESEKSDNHKGPRFCSVRMQYGSKNILLDNVSNSFSPVLYTHPLDKKHKKLNPKVSQTDYQKINFPVFDSKMMFLDKTNISLESLSSGERKSLSFANENAIQNHQRVVEWIESNQNNLDDDCSGSDNSRCDTDKKGILITDIDPDRYAEMENNVKKFLFGESQSEFLRKVEIGKQNYQNLRGNNNDKQVSSRSKSHLETEI